MQSSSRRNIYKAYTYKYIVVSKVELEIPEVIKKSELLKKKSYERERYIQKIIKETLEMNPYGVILKALEKSLPFDYRTIEKHLFALTFTNEVYTEKIGASTLYLSNLIEVEDTNDIELNDYKYEISIIKNRRGEFVLIRQFEGEDIKGGIVIPKDKFGEFIEFQQDV